MRGVLLVVLIKLWINSAEEIHEGLDSYIIACHTTDFECFKKQYHYLRDFVLMGNDLLPVAPFHPYHMLYGDTGTCVRVTGFDESQLVGISMDGNRKELTITLSLPVRLQQILKNDTLKCSAPDKKFKDAKHQNDTILKKFSGNATVQVTYPFELRLKDGKKYLNLMDEDVDILLDIADLSGYKKDDDFQALIYQQSEWAYEMAQHFDAAESFALPYTCRLKTVGDKIPLQRLLLLYPEEDYHNIQFSFYDTS